MTSPHAILRLAAFREAERKHLKAVPPLMERAGMAAASLAKALLGRSASSILIAAGPGNNGGDAFVVARLLREQGHVPLVVFLGQSDKLPPDARGAYEAWTACGGKVQEEVPSKECKFDLVIDGLFGIGLTRPLEGNHAILVERINALPCPIVALDIPSGLDSETGRVLGIGVRATHTASFIALKPGLLTLDGPDYSGTISAHDLGLDLAIDAGAGLQVSPDLFKELLKPRPRNSHKGSYGNVGIIGGAPGMAGAALLAGRAALKLGAGRVYVGMLAQLSVDPLQPELMLRKAEEVFAVATCLVVGPGLGQSEEALSLLRRAIASALPLLLDADALNLIAIHPVLARNLSRRNAPTVMTPHPTEAARLLGVDTAAVQADRLAATLELARRFQAATVLKGCGSILAMPDGSWFINTTGNPGLAAAGTGDVLSGMIIALMAQGWPCKLALLAAVHLHGAAADACVARGDGPIGLSASDLAEAARTLLNQWIATSPR